MSQRNFSVLVFAGGLPQIAKLSGDAKSYAERFFFFPKNVAQESPIPMRDIERASEKALKRLDESFFKVRFERLTKAKVDYVHAMASLGSGPYGVNDVAMKLEKDPRALGPRRSSIIRKGMIYSPSFGDVDFTVPLFDDFLRRTSGRV